MLVLATGFLSLPPAQQVSPSDISRDCRVDIGNGILAPRFFRIVTLYRRGLPHVALNELREVTAEDIEATVDRLTDLKPARPGEAPPMIPVSDGLHFPEDNCLRGAAMLHTEFAMLAAREAAHKESEFHAGIARRLIDLIKNDRSREEFLRDWLLANGYFYQRAIYEQGVDNGPVALARFYFEAKRSYDEAVERFSSDTDVLLAAGTLYEWSATSYAMELGQLEVAERYYRRAANATPPRAEAQLRLGRVLEKLGKYDAAKAPLRTAVELNEAADLTYLARLVLGRIAEREGQPDEAIVHYRTAIELIPGWQVGHLALGRALHALGRRTESREVLLRAIDRKPSSTDEYNGWWTYELGRTSRFKPLWESMLAEIAL